MERRRLRQRAGTVVGARRVADTRGCSAVPAFPFACRVFRSCRSHPILTRARKPARRSLLHRRECLPSRLSRVSSPPVHRGARCATHALHHAADRAIAAAPASLAAATDSSSTRATGDIAQPAASATLQSMSFSAAQHSAQPASPPLPHSSAPIRTCDSHRRSSHIVCDGC